MEEVEIPIQQIEVPQRSCALLDVVKNVVPFGSSEPWSMDRLVERGERVQWEVTEAIREVMGQFRLQSQAPDPHQVLGGNLEWLTHRLGLPSRRDFDLLQARLDQLQSDLEALNKAV